MAFPFSCFSEQDSTFSISNEEFNLFHDIDRKLFSRLVMNLGRDPAESMQVMALWLWLERSRYCKNMIDIMLPLPLTLINSLADEAVVCLYCIEHDDFPSHFENFEIVLTQNFAQTEISLYYFHRIRVHCLRGVTLIISEVCSRAFQDILRNILNHNNTRFEESVGVEEEQNVYGPILGFPVFGNPSLGFVPYERNMGGPMDQRAIMEGVANASRITHAFDQYDLAYQRHVLSNDLSNLLGNMNLASNYDDEDEKDGFVPPADERTIFLTFSKGYPISENEVREYVTRRYGDCIEEIFMQEVLLGEQVLYARMVVKSASGIDAVLEGKNKVKFSINGKHVWARKYVRKQHSASSSSGF